MNKFKIYNTLTRKIEIFEPWEKSYVKMYVCGPTVYDSCHIGHARVFTFFDFLARWIRFQGYTLKFVMNITDIDDKIINRANELNISWKEVSEFFTEEFFKDMKALGNTSVSMFVRATEVIPTIIWFIEKLLEKGYAYIAKDGVYFDVSKFKDYGKLSKISKEELKQHRIEPSPYKRNPEDFALWKFKKDPLEPSWESPWGEGRPGWHIECSAMNYKYLGEQIDIHGGGNDLIFPHHENEIAQTEALTGKQFAKYWVHVGMVKIKGEKMSKSLGNIITIKEVLKNYDKNTIRWFLLGTHYRKPLDYSEEALEKAKKASEKIQEIYELLKDIEIVFTNYLNIRTNPIEDYINKIIQALRDDINTALALNIYYEMLIYIENNIKIFKEDELIIIKYWFEKINNLFGFSKIENPLEQQLLDLIVSVRNELRKRKLYEISDEIREKLKVMGYEVMDTKDGSIVYKK